MQKLRMEIHLKLTGNADGHDVLSSAGFSVNNDSYAEHGFGTLAADLEHATVIRMRAGNANQSNNHVRMIIPFAILARGEQKKILKIYIYLRNLIKMKEQSKL
jgi:hypothetical protein